MQPTITREQRQAAKRQLIEPIAQGTSVRQVRAVADVPMHRTTVYRLLKRVRTEGETAFSDGRHGHPIKLRGGAVSLQLSAIEPRPGGDLCASECRFSTSARWASSPLD